jgi:hypothetical protein
VLICGPNCALADGKATSAIVIVSIRNRAIAVAILFLVNFHSPFIISLIQGQCPSQTNLYLTLKKNKQHKKPNNDNKKRSALKENGAG